MRVGVIGAGAAGLCAVKRAISFGCEVIAFEQSDKIGGTWKYTDAIGKDKHGNDIHSSMYRGLHTNLPKELMSFPDFPFPHQEKSFIPAKEVDEYLELYADAFTLRPHIKFEHQVLRVKPDYSGWHVIVLNLSSGANETYNFDCILVCNGHFSTPLIPVVTGAKSFRGKQIHSHAYRHPDVFSEKRVLVVGGGPSGVDISQEIAHFAKKVFWSNHVTPPKVVSALNIVQKNDVEKLTEEGAVFIDGSLETFDEIVYCTGYTYTFPFLSDDSGISWEDNYVRPLFKHCLSITNPSMALIGLPFLVCPFQMFDLQIRFCLTFMTGRRESPSKDEMHRDTEMDMNERWHRGLKKSKAHAMGRGVQDKYYADLASSARIDPIKPFVCRMYDKNRTNVDNDLANYRRYKFTLLDDENFETKLESL